MLIMSIKCMLSFPVYLCNTLLYQFKFKPQLALYFNKKKINSACRGLMVIIQCLF